MKKNKTIAYMLAATLLVGGTFVGTKAWFSDKVSTDNGIKITMGTLDLELVETQTGEGENIVKGWQLVRGPQDTDNESTTGPGGRNGEIANEFKEIRPGDYFKRTITLKNTGSLDQLVSVAKSTQGTLGNLFTLELSGNENLNKNNEFRMNAGTETTLTLTLTPDKVAIDNQYNAKSAKYAGSNVFDLNDALGKLEITGRQINADVNELSTEHVQPTTPATN